MAGMKVVVVKAADDGEVDLDDLRAQCEQHADDLAAIMVTYPSTHGVFEDTITELCAIVHDARRPGLRRRRQPQRAGRLRQARRVRRRRLAPQPAQDVLHPARRRRPGRRPGRRARAPRAVPAQPPAAPRAREREGIGPITAAPYGSAGILPISWAYVRLMGAEGLTRATAVAVLAANYVAARLRRALPGALPAATAGWSRTSASSTCAASPRRPASASTTSPSG